MLKPCGLRSLGDGIPCRRLWDSWQVGVVEVENLWPGFAADGRPLAVCKVRTMGIDQAYWSEVCIH